MKRMLRFAIPAYLLLEAYATLTIASRLGPAATLLLLVLGAAAGVAVLRTAQFALLSRLRPILASGAPLLPELLDAALRAAAGFLLIIPGFVSDVIALGLLIPQLRQRLVRRLSAGSPADPASPVVIDGDYRRIDDPVLPAPKRGPG